MTKAESAASRTPKADTKYWREVANTGRGSTMTACLHKACDTIAALELEAAALREHLDSHIDIVKQLQRERDDLRERLAKARAEARNQARESLSVIEAILKSLTHPMPPTATEWVELRGIARAHLATIEAQKGADHE